MATFFAHLLYILLFFFAFNREKKWESGHKPRKPAWLTGILLATFVFKSGQKVGKWPQIWPKTPHFLPNYSSYRPSF